MPYMSHPPGAAHPPAAPHVPSRRRPVQVSVAVLVRRLHRLWVLLLRVHLHGSDGAQGGQREGLLTGGAEAGVGIGGVGVARGAS